jgi:hypothetical protein
MNTTRNRAMVLAHFLRAAVTDIRSAERRGDVDARHEHDNALASIEAVAEELETVARPPAPGSSSVINSSEKL